MSNAVIKVNEAKIQEMREHYSKYIQSKQPQGSRFVAKPPSCTVTAYKSGKVLFQGGSAEVEAAKWGEKQPAKQKKAPSSQPSSKYAPPLEIANLSIIGSDEVGTGDYFGPMTVVAAFVSNDHIDKLKSLGVKDSKNLDDFQITSIAKAILPIIPYSLLVLHNERYNKLQATGMTQGKMKALLHNQAINNVVEKIDKNTEVDGVLIDQFVVPETFFKHIKGKEHKWSNLNQYFSTKAEGVHLAVAAASIIARYAFVNEFEKLSSKAGFTIPKGAGAHVDVAAAKLIKSKGEDALQHFTKYHFANTAKALKISNR